VSIHPALAQTRSTTQDVMRALPNADPALHAVQARSPRRPALLAGILAEYRRAIAAAQRYDDLTLHFGSVVPRDEIPRRVFEEFYRDGWKILD
jgi:hypothetical protein